jgi:hypothetical protein
VRRDELRALLIEVGQEILIDEGLATGTERLTFKRVFDRAADEHGVQITNASVLGRIWDDMAEYQAAVLASVLWNDDDQDIEDTLTSVVRVLEEADLSSPERRTAAAAEVVRVGCLAHIDAVQRSRTVSLQIGLRGLSVSRLPADSSPVSEGARRAYDEFGRRWDAVFEYAFGVLGIRVRPGFSLRQLSMLAISLTEGFIIWDRIDPDRTRGIVRPTGPDGEDREWTLFSIGVDAVVRLCTELADDPA